MSAAGDGIASGTVIASVGQTATQRPQPRQRSGATARLTGSMASVGQMSAQREQPASGAASARHSAPSSLAVVAGGFK
jgi:hypothetical protein